MQALSGQQFDHELLEIWLSHPNDDIRSAASNLVEKDAKFFVI
jgi:hypothetical protein